MVREQSRGGPGSGGVGLPRGIRRMNRFATARGWASDNGAAVRVRVE
jgi:hypothetical protein